MDEILSLEKGIFSSLDMSKANSMTMGGQCRLSPLIVCIQVGCWLSGGYRGGKALKL